MYLLPAVLALLACAGCTTTEVNRQSAALQADYALLQEQNQQLRGRLTDLERQMDRIHADLDQLRRASGGANRLDGELERLDRKITALEAARIQDRKEIIDQLSAKIAALVAKGSTSRPSGSRRTSEYGREHVVQAGQTLSEIARAYGSTTRAIMEANQIQNPDALRVGQKLFIPD